MLAARKKGPRFMGLRPPHFLVGFSMGGHPIIANPRSFQKYVPVMRTY